ncbi:MAG: ATP-binding protein [Symploca sp. SIO1B1]|nr:ATP-binding protein [Symploca sp. SIO1B1]
MPQVELLKIFLASPSDVSRERDYVEEVVEEINRTTAPSKGVRLEVVRSEKSAYPGYGGGGQAVLNAQIADMEEYELFVGIMWNRLGTPTPRAESGTVEEYERAVAAFEQDRKPDIWFYFREAAAQLNSESSLEQRGKLLAFKRKVQSKALTHDYKKPIDFRNRFRQDLSLWLSRWEKTEDNQEKTNRNPFQSNTQRIIDDKVKDFVGREFVFEAIDNFFNTEPNGYFTIEADPGVGKSAILAKYAQQNDCLVHFNVRSLSNNRTSQFLENICTQLIERYNLSYKSLPADATRDGNFLGHLLNEVSNRLGEEDKVVIAVDALDEVDLASQDAGANILYLPPYLPDGVYFLLTRRRVTLPFVVHTPQHLFNLMEYFDESRQDIEEYIRGATRRERLLVWIQTRELTTEEFTEQLADKSDNNFMYLRYVLPQIEKGFYQDLSINSLPKGLEGYYEDHWVRMGMTAKPLPRTKLKIVYILGEILQPVSSQLISEYANEEQLTVQDVIDEWEQFLHKQPIDNQTCYSIYHASFQDFLNRKDIVQAASVDIKDINGMIADFLWEDLFGDE